MAKRMAFGSVIVLAVLASSRALAGEAATAPFDRFKALEGDWTSRGGDGSVSVRYHVTAAGTAVVETLLPGTPHEMVTVFTVDKGDLVLTHYCAAGNQPHMKATRGGDANSVHFKFDGGGNMKSPNDGHMHEATFVFTDADHLKTIWQFYENGKPGKTEEFSLVRKKG